MQIKTTAEEPSHAGQNGCHQAIHLQTIQHLQTINVGEGVEKRELSYCWWECKLVQPLWRTSVKIP